MSGICSAHRHHDPDCPQCNAIKTQIIESICIFCGKKFIPWKDEYGDINDEACKSCDSSYEDGMLDDRERTG